MTFEIKAVSNTPGKFLYAVHEGGEQIGQFEISAIRAGHIYIDGNRHCLSTDPQRCYINLYGVQYGGTVSWIRNDETGEWGPDLQYLHLDRSHDWRKPAGIRAVQKFRTIVEALAKQFLEQYPEELVKAGKRALERARERQQEKVSEARAAYEKEETELARLLKLEEL